MAEERLSESSAFKYQVFLSFRGPDTRQAFTDTLFELLRDAGVRVFRDNNELRVGHVIGEDLMQGISDSQIYIPIFSQRYAESKWCLRELAAMVDAARKSKDKEIIPIFCGVTTDDVKRENGLYDVALTAQREDRETIQQWKEALRRVCKIKGWELKDEGHATFCKSIVREISVKLKVKHKKVTDCLVGMGDQVEDLINLLDMESHGVKFVGIHGMGGIGKTTLAKVVFNRLSASFDACSFVSDVREKSDSKGLVYIQKQMLKDLGGSIEIDDEDDGINNIISVSRMKKVLIVLDDVSRKKQIEKLAGASNWFGARSKIIVTTRDKRNFEIKGPEIKPFEKEELDEEQALKLFSLHTFGKNTPPKDYFHLSQEVISFTGRLPLAIEIIGSLLRVREEEFWRNKIEELKTIPIEDVQEKLRISYNSLDSREKEIFLDISCLFDGESTTNPIYMWDACGFFPKAKVDVLVLTSLIKIKDGKFWMHDQVKDLGREIVRTENMEYPKKRSRIWEENEAWRILKCLKKGRGKLKAIRLHDDPFSDSDCTFTSEDLTGLENIRFLELPSCARIIGDLRDSFPNMRWFRLWNCDSVMKAANFRMKSLVILELTGSDVSECWDGWNQIKMMDNLKVLDLRGSKSLRKLPDLSGCKSLERLILEGCENMTEIHSSIGNLKALKYLNCRFCGSLRGLPEEIISLEELEEILISGFFQSFDLPESICTLKSLKILNLSTLRISRLPQRLGNLTSLVNLWLNSIISVTELPDTIGELVNLECLTLFGCSKLENLPDSVQNLKSLVVLDLGCSGIRNLPDCLSLSELQRLTFQASTVPVSLGLMKSLVQLVLQGAQVTELPGFIENLKLLKELNIANSRIRKLPSSIGKLKQLESIHASDSSLSVIPTEIGELSCLLHLDLQGTGIRGLPSEISHLPSLRVLWLGNCDELQELPQLPSSLENLIITSKSLKELPDLSNCTNLTTLALQGGEPVSQLECFNLDWIRRCSKLRTLTLGISKLTCLPSEIHAIYLNLDCPDLEQISKVIGLRRLQLHQSPVCSKPIYFLDAETMDSLTYLSVSGCHPLEALAPFSKLHGLECITWSCDKLDGRDFMFLTEWKFLKELTITSCDSLETLCNLSKLENLEVLHIFGCNNLKEDKGLGELKSLKKLKIRSCKSLERLTDLSKLEKLKDLEIEFCPELREGIWPCMLQSLKHYRIYDCKHLDSFFPDHLKIKGAYRTEKCVYRYRIPADESDK